MKAGGSRAGLAWRLALYSGLPYSYTPHTTKLLLGILISLSPSIPPSVHPSVRPVSHVRSVASTALVGSISYLYILSSNLRRYVACKVSCKIPKFRFLAFLKNF